MHNSKKDGRAAGENRIIHPHLLHEEQLSPEKALEYSLFTVYILPCNVLHQLVILKYLSDIEDVGVEWSLL